MREKTTRTILDGIRKEILILSEYEIYNQEKCG